MCTTCLVNTGVLKPLPRRAVLDKDGKGRGHGRMTTKNNTGQKPDIVIHRHALWKGATRSGCAIIVQEVARHCNGAKTRRDIQETLDIAYGLQRRSYVYQLVAEYA
jgi:hypothetical protein